tara:strand:+ start:20123 stop:20587 length:465 start_codon:yes stop_codon:yes gene_type:complete
MMVRRYLKIVAALLVILIAGVGIGYSVGLREGKQRHRKMGKPEGWATMMMNRLDSELDLTAEQRDAIQPILQKTSSELHQYRRMAMNRSWTSIREFYEELETHLSDEQKEELKASRQKVRERLQNQPNRKGEPSPPPGPPWPRSGGIHPSEPKD